MKLKDINAEITFELWMTPALYEETPTTGVGSIAPHQNDQGIQIKNRWPAVEHGASGYSGRKRSEFSLKKRLCAPCRSHAGCPGSQCVGENCLFNGEIVEIGDVEIGIDERIELTAKRNGIRFSGTEELGAY
ncbi:hypothetical protein LNP24_28125 [Klebsiella pneumoniae subsp. pneumoniae]|nr:hypothetical protein [Klebsiella pneumoniae subsp. pneumoniae]